MHGTYSEALFIQEKVDELIHDAIKRCELSLDMVIKQLHALAFFFIIEFIDNGNTISNLFELTRTKLKPVTGIKVREKTDFEVNPFTTSELKLADKRAALVDLGRHLGTFEEENEQSAVKIKVTRKCLRLR